MSSTQTFISGNRRAHRSAQGGDDGYAGLGPDVVRATSRPCRAPDLYLEA